MYLSTKYIDPNPEGNHKVLEVGTLSGHLLLPTTLCVGGVGGMLCNGMTLIRHNDFTFKIMHCCESLLIFVLFIWLWVCKNVSTAIFETNFSYHS